MAEAGLGVYNGFLEGRIIADVGGNPVLLPFGSSIAKASFKFASEVTVVETLDERGILGASMACPYRNECSMSFETNALSKAFLQASLDTLIGDQSVPQPRQYSVVLSTEVSGNSTFTLPVAPMAGQDLTVSDLSGKQYVVDNVTGAVVTLDGLFTGTKVYCNYFVAASGTDNEIALGSTDSLGIVKLYGIFKGCPGNIRVIMEGVIEADVSLESGKDGATSSMMLKAIRDIYGNYAYLQFL